MAKKGADKKKMVGLIFLVVGVILIGWGINEAGTLNNKLARALGSTSSDRVLWFYISGGVCAGIGFFNLFKK